MTARLAKLEAENAELRGRLAAARKAAGPSECRRQ